MTTVVREEDEWELVNDDGFVYKRKKRPRVDPPTTTSSSVPPPSDPAAEEKNRRERKKMALTKLRDKYQTEIDRWEHLSNVLKALQEKAQSQQQQSHEQTATVSSFDSALGLPPPPGKSSENSDQPRLDDLLLRVEAEEAVIQDASNLCDMAEAICNVQEETMKQTFVDLPVWASPAELMASLCDKRSEPEPGR